MGWAIFIGEQSSGPLDAGDAGAGVWCRTAGASKGLVGVGQRRANSQPATLPALSRGHQSCTSAGRTAVGPRAPAPAAALVAETERRMGGKEERVRGESKHLPVRG